jgi:hypothetical protein
MLLGLLQSEKDPKTRRYSSDGTDRFVELGGGGHFMSPMLTRKCAFTYDRVHDEPFPFH